MVPLDNEIPVPFVSQERKVLPEWIDWNGHMNIAYYVVAFDLATDDIFDYLGIGSQYRKESGHSTFTLELHVNYLQEVMEGEPFVVHSTVLGSDRKRLHLFHTMCHGKTGQVVATNENMFVHVNMTERRSAPYPQHILERLTAVAEAHKTLPRPENAGRSVGF